jgi:hypothetical protein
MLNTFIADAVDVRVASMYSLSITISSGQGAKWLIFHLPASELENMHKALEACSYRAGEACSECGSPQVEPPKAVWGVSQVQVSRSPSGVVRLSTTHWGPTGTEIVAYLPEILRYELSALLKKHHEAKTP